MVTPPSLSSLPHSPLLPSSTPPLFPPSLPPPLLLLQALLQASGKIKRPKSQRKTKQPPSQSKGKEKKEKKEEEEGGGRGGAAVPDAVIKEFFEVFEWLQYRGLARPAPSLVSLVHLCVGRVWEGDKKGDPNPGV